MNISSLWPCRLGTDRAEIAEVIKYLPGRHSGVVVSAAASQLEGCGFDTWPGICVEFVSVWVFQLPPTLQKRAGNSEFVCVNFYMNQHPLCAHTRCGRVMKG